jgi:hypothetical protein
VTSANDPERDPTANAAAGERARGVLRLELELEMDREPVRGVLRRGERSEEFVGWLALADALGRLHEGSRTGRAATQTDP